MRFIQNRRVHRFFFSFMSIISSRDHFIFIVGSLYLKMLVVVCFSILIVLFFVTGFFLMCLWLGNLRRGKGRWLRRGGIYLFIWGGDRWFLVFVCVLIDIVSIFSFCWWFRVFMVICCFWIFIDRNIILYLSFWVFRISSHSRFSYFDMIQIN